MAVVAHGDVIRSALMYFLAIVRLDREFLSLVVAVIGTTLSAYLYTWQSDEEVEENIAMGRRRLSDRRGATREEMRHTAADVVLGIKDDQEPMPPCLAVW